MSQSIQLRPSLRRNLLEKPELLSREGDLLRFLAVSAQLGLVLAVMHLFRVEQDSGLLRLSKLIFGGFLIHAFLPLRWRLPFFLGLSLVAISTILGVKQGVGLIALGLGLIGICHLPVAFSIRVALVVGAGAILAMVRGGWLYSSWMLLPTLVVPVLGAMFMFRLMIYLYDLRHEKEPASIWERLSYFFMLPNVCFLLFPVVDYQMFRRTYYDGDAVRIYQKGVLWMYRGVVHLLLYRLVYHHLLPNPLDVATLGGVVHMMLTTYLLYLRISGQFHLIIGITCLFGFNLPETHRLYFLASSFSDYWRRINIYWKDFMMKIFYYPSLMRLRRWGMTTAIIGATSIVFVGTWLLHSYQWFWLRGTFPVTAPDALFWGILGALVVVNSLYEAKRTRKRSLSRSAWSLQASVLLSMKTVGMFVLICILWSLWSSESVGAWLVLLSKAGNSSPASFALLLLLLAALVGVGVAIQYATNRGWTLTITGSSPSFIRSASVTSFGSMVLLLVGLPHVSQYVGAPATAVVASLQQERLNRQDELQSERGYYEGLLNTEKYTSALWRVQRRGDRPDDWTEEGVYAPTGDLREKELIPQLDIVWKQADFRTNRWGMRDKDYEAQKPPGTYRMALLGASHVMGAGVGNEETFESVLEKRLNEENRGEKFITYEILNFAVGGTGFGQQVATAETRVFQFAPDAVLNVAHPDEFERTAERLASTLARKIEVEDESLQELLEEAGVVLGMHRGLISRRLYPIRERLIEWGYEKLSALCSEHGARPVLVFMPLVRADFETQEFDRLSELAEAAGFTLLDLRGVYQNYEEDAIIVAEWDNHPNALGHRLVADRLYEKLLEHESELGLGFSSGLASVFATGDNDARTP